MSLVWFYSRDKVVPEKEAVLLASLPGALYGESLFETLRVTEGRVFRLEEHLARLQRGAKRLGWRAVPEEALLRGLAALLGDERLRERDVRVRITLIAVSDHGDVDCFIQAAPYVPPDAALYQTGVGARIASVRLDETAPWASIKHGNRLPHRFARREAGEKGEWEGLLLNSRGMLADGSVSSVHFVLGGRLLCTPSAASGALEGIVRAEVRAIAEALDIPYREGGYHPSLLRQASEAFLTNSLIGILPLVRVDGLPIGDGRPGPMTRLLMEELALRRNIGSAPLSLP